MRLDTDDCRRIAQCLRSLKVSGYFDNPLLQSRHAGILRRLDALESFFNRLADLVENNEITQSSVNRIQIHDSPGFTVQGGTSGSVSRLINGRTVSAWGDLGYTLAAGGTAWSSSWGSASIQASAVEATISADASFRAMRGKTFNPRLEVQAIGSAHLAAAQTSASADLGFVGVEGVARAEIGAVYGEAHALFSMDEQVISAQIGAAAARGECVFAFEIADFRVSIGMSGSVGSFEAGFEYANEPGTWQIEAKGALFAGAGLRIRIDY